MYAIIRVRGKISINKDIEDTMQLLNLTRVNHCVLYKESDKIAGMLKKAKDFITWGIIDADTLAKLLLKRGNIYTPDNKLVAFSETHDEAKAKKIAEELISGKTTVKTLNLKPVFRLRPPRKGYERKGVKNPFSIGGALGNRQEKISELVKKMI
ncbi:MAG: 50S ribosomal protein L30 [archaeon]